MKKERQRPERFAKLGPALRMLRRQRRIRAVDVAGALGVDVSMINRWESGSVVPSLDSFGLLADHYRLYLGDVDDLLATYAGRPRPARSVQPPRSAAEVDTMVQALLPPPADGALERDLRPNLRRVLRAVLMEVLVLNGYG